MSADETELRTAWRRCAGTSRAARAALEGLLERHREPHRRAHGTSHVAWVVRHVGALGRTEPIGDSGAVVAAAFFHDAVYDPTASDNEAASARLASRELTDLGWADDRVGRVVAMIEATSGHDPAGADIDTRVLLDADLAVLGSDPAAYQAYATGVRAEYAHVDDAAWRRGRAAVLEGFLARPTIYATATAVDRWEHAARANVTAELASLR